MRASIASFMRRLRREEGMAVPTVLSIIGISTAFVAVAIASSINAQQGSTRDQDSKAALTAADAALSQALLRQNRYQTTASAPCIKVVGGALTTGAADPSTGWCPAVTGTVGTTTYTYWVTPARDASNHVVPITIVGQGASDNVTRRVAVGADAISGSTLLANEGVIGQDTISLQGNPTIQVGTGTNGSVVLGGSATICNNIRHGVGQSYSHSGSSGQCPGYVVTEENRTLPPLTLPPGLSTGNSNFRLVTCTSPNVPAGCGLDTYSKQRNSTTPWDPTTRTISIGQNATLTMGGGDYFICRLDMANGDLIMAAGAHIRLYFDTPENCGLSAGASQISAGGNGHISATAFDASTGVFDLPGLFLLGSTTIPTTATLGGNSGADELVIYAPNTDVTFQGNSTLYGALAAKTLTLGGDPTISYPNGAPPPFVDTYTTYKRNRYVECTGAATSSPNSGC